MYLTKAQMRALWFIIVVFGISVFYQYARVWFFPEPAYDFSSFEQAFIRRRDSLLAQEKLDSLREISEQQQKQVSYQSAEIKGFPVNINTASNEQLQQLPRIGPAMAARIIEYRTQNGNFKSKEELMKVRGIGEKTFRNLKDKISIQ
jgi:comEA protein